MTVTRCYLRGIILTIHGELIAGSVRMKVKNQKFRQLREAPLTLPRVMEMLVHAYGYVRAVDPNGESGAAELLWSKYKQLKRLQANAFPGCSKYNLESPKPS